MHRPCVILREVAGSTLANDVVSGGGLRDCARNDGYRPNAGYASAAGGVAGAGVGSTAGAGRLARSASAVSGSGT